MIAVVQPQLIVASLIFWSLRNMNLSIKLQHPVSLLKADLVCYLKIVVLFLLCSGYMHSEICKTHKFAFAWAVPLNFNFFFWNWYRRKCKIQTRLLGKFFISFLPLPPGVWPFFTIVNQMGLEISPPYALMGHFTSKLYS